jgi:hypothetical protein
MVDERTVNPALSSYHHNHVVVFGSHWKSMLRTGLHTHTQGHEASSMLEMEMEEARLAIRTPNILSTDVVVHVPHVLYNAKPKDQTQSQQSLPLLVCVTEAYSKVQCHTCPTPVKRLSKTPEHRVGLHVRV